MPCVLIYPIRKPVHRYFTLVVSGKGDASVEQRHEPDDATPKHTIALRRGRKCLKLGHEPER